MLGTYVNNTIEVLGLVALAILAVFIGIQKLVKDWRSTSAETSIITMMHTELERMSEQNIALSTELGRLHTEVIALNQQLQKLTVENQRLQTEVCALTEQIGTFKRFSDANRGSR
jgi:regulator of replication initiation timing